MKYTILVLNGKSNRIVSSLNIFHRFDEKLLEKASAFCHQMTDAKKEYVIAVEE